MPRINFRLLAYMVLLIVLGMRSYGLTIPASEDTVGYLNKLTAASNASPTLQVDASHKSFLYFNLDDVPQDAVLRWAKLRIFLPSVRLRGSGLSIHAVTSQWDEALASPQPSIEPLPLGIIPAEKLGIRRFVSIDITNIVQAWIAGRLRMKD